MDEAVINFFSQACLIGGHMSHHTRTHERTPFGVECHLPLAVHPSMSKPSYPARGSEITDILTGRTETTSLSRVPNFI